MTLEKTELQLGFIALTDCAPLVVAQELGLFARHGLNVTLVREHSWASIRDKVALGLLDGAQMLAGMPLAMTLGIGPVREATCTALTLGLNGNAITLRSDLVERMETIEVHAGRDPLAAARALRTCLTDGFSAERPLTLATVFPVSNHHYQLRHWLATEGIDVDRDLRLVVVPPERMVEHLRQGVIDGYCVGEPWNTQAVELGIGRIVATGYQIWNNAPEKVLGVTRNWLQAHPNTHHALLLALLEAAQWLDRTENRLQAARLLSRAEFLNTPVGVIAPTLIGQVAYHPGAAPRMEPDFHVFHRYAANFPWRSHGLWLLAQMRQCGQIDTLTGAQAVVDAVYQPDLYRAAAAELGIAAPLVDHRVEGTHSAGWTLDEATSPIPMGPNRLLGGRRFDPAHAEHYLATAPSRVSPPAALRSES